MPNELSADLGSRNRIDVHQHIVPPSYAAWLAELGRDAGGLPIPEWSTDAALAAMETNGIATTILSVSTPGVVFEGVSADTARAKARELNEFTAEVVRGAPDRFGFFATVTLPDVDGALEAAAYALDELGADGIVLHANSEGRYLGHPDFRPLLDELGRRKTTVFVHPGDLPGGAVEGIPSFFADFLLDTVRAAVSLVQARVPQDLPDLKFILSHAGGFLPYAAYRLAPFFSEQPGDMAGGLAVLRSFYFDLALSSSPTVMPSLLAFADPTHVLYGSDFPYAPPAAGAGFTRMLDAAPLDDTVRQAINRSNAEVLFPRLARA